MGNITYIMLRNQDLNFFLYWQLLSTNYINLDFKIKNFFILSSIIITILIIKCFFFLKKNSNSN